MQSGASLAKAGVNTGPNDLFPEVVKRIKKQLE
jgi:hypothetical protein